MKFLSRLSGRKFLLTVAGSVYFALIGDTASMLMLIFAFLGIEGSADLVSRLRQPPGA